MEHLFKQLRKYADGDMYPYHMPGHKRQAWGALPQQLYELDITEIEGFDNLHQAEGILQDDVTTPSNASTDVDRP